MYPGNQTLPKDKTSEIPQYRAVQHDRPIQDEARGGDLIIYVRAILAFSICLAAGTYISPETSNFLRRVGFSDSEFQTELQQLENNRADLIADEPLWDLTAKPTVRGEFFGKKMLDANGAFLNTGAPTNQDPSTGIFSNPDVTVVHESLNELCG